MPDLLDRTEREEETAALLLVLFDDYQTRALELMGDPPKAQNVPGYFYDEIQADVAAALIPILAATYAYAGDTLADQFRVGIDTATQGARAQQWAEARAEQLATELQERIRVSVAEAVERFETATVLLEEAEQAVAAEAEAVKALEEALQTIFSADRAEAIGITETTMAATAGEHGSARDIERELGVTLVGYWHTERDSAVCPQCRPLDGVPDDIWQQSAPKGPPLHPRCRCWLSWDVDERPWSAISRS